MSACLGAPIVLAHGLFGFQRIQVGQLTVSAYFRGIPERLAASGNRVLAPQVSPIAGVASRAQQLGAKIEEAFPGEAVHLIGHSMGGLDARLLAADPSWRHRILSVTTIASPHLGSSLAEFAKLRVGRVYRLLETLGIDHRGFLDLTPRAMERFNAQVAIPDHVRCFSIAGNPSDDAISWPLRRLHTALSELEGVNDGLVSVASARAFGTALEDWKLDHLRQVNWIPRVGVSAIESDPVELFGAVVDHLGHAGFAVEAPASQSLSTPA